MIKFYTKTEKFEVGHRQIYKDGEVIIEGNVYIHRLIFGEPAYIIVNASEQVPPFILKTETIIGVLPDQQVFEGIPIES